MHTNKLINKKSALIIGIGLVLSLSVTESNAAPSLDTSEFVSKVEPKKLRATKKNKNAKAETTTNSETDAKSLNAQEQVKPSVKESTKAAKPEKLESERAPIQAKQLAAINVAAGRSRNLIGIVGSASQGVVSQEQIEFRSIARNGELIELIPGMIVTQHSGSGKANQYFLRGFDLDHGTDFTTIVDGIPMNMQTHAHGQGYMDINSLIPELVEKIDYGKGPYYAEVGDFSVAGYNKMTSMKRLPQGIFKFTGGEFGYYRTLAANSNKIGDGNLLYAGEFQFYDGAWAIPENTHKYNGMMRYSLDQEKWGLAVNAKAYTNTWTSTNQIAQSAIDSGQLGLYSSLSPSDGATSNRYSLSSNVWNKGENWKSDANLYALYYDLNMFSNFTGYLSGAQGDQVDQKEHRIQIGGSEELTHYDNLLGFDVDNSYGVNFQLNYINGLGVNETVNRHYLNTISLSNVEERTAGAFFKTQIHWHEKFRTIQALRADIMSAQVTQLANGYTYGNAAIAAADTSNYTAYSPAIKAGEIQAQNTAYSDAINAANSGSVSKAMLSPKFSAIIGPWYDTEYYFNIGYGYHSNDARGALDSLSSINQLANGQNAFTPSQLNSGVLTTAADGSTLKPTPFMSWSRGAEIGARTSIIPKLNTTLTLWWMQSSSELRFDGDTGTTTANGMSDRYGLELTNYFKVNDWLTLDFDLSKSDGYFVNTPTTNALGCPTAGPTPCVGNLIPNLVGTVIAGGIQVAAPNGLFGSLRIRHFGDSPLDSNGTFWAADVNILNLGLGYKEKNYKLDFSLFNLLGQETSDVAYAYNYAATALNTTPGSASAQAGNFGVVRHPVEPRMARAGFTLYF